MSNKIVIFDLDGTLADIRHDEDRQILDTLTAIETQIREGKLYLQLGVDTEYVSQLRAILQNPEDELTKMSEMLARAFIVFFWERAKEPLFSKYYNKMGAWYKGSRVYLWLYLNDEYVAEFSTRSKFYELKAEIANSPIFSQLEIDFMILGRDEIDLPEDFIRLVG